LNNTHFLALNLQWTGLKLHWSVYQTESNTFRVRAPMSSA